MPLRGLEVTAGSGTECYRAILQAEFSRRHAANARYSQRAFARDLAISQGRLSDILSAKQGLSPLRAVEVARRLGFSASETEHFRDLVAREHGRSQVERVGASARLKKVHATPRRKQLLEDTFRVVADWHHLAILELTKLAEFRSDPAWIASLLGISPYEAKLAVGRLRRLHLLHFAGDRVVATDVEMSLASSAPSESVRKFHRQIMLRAMEALELQDLETREFSAVIFAAKAASVAKLKAQMRRFVTEIASEPSEGADTLYCFSHQLFRVAQASNRSMP